MINSFRRCWTWLGEKTNFNSVMALATVALALIALATLFISLIPPSDKVSLSLEEFQVALERRGREVEERLVRVHDNERTRLQNELIEVKRQLSNIDAAYANALTKIRELESAVARLGDGVGHYRLAEIRAAIEAFDFSKADTLLAEVEDSAEVAVGRAAEAAFQRGEIAVLRIRWDKAATHFDKAARLSPTYDYLNQAGQFAMRAARYGTARGHFARLLELSRHEHGERSPETAAVLSNLAGLLQATGQYKEAEPLFRQAVEVIRETLGEKDPNYATVLNNFALLLHDTGQYEEAEPLFRQAL